MIRGVYDALASPMAPAEPPAAPAIAIKKSVTRNHIVCLEDAKELRMLRRHLRTAHNLSPDEYREKWGLSSNYPMTAPAYAERRSAFAKAIGLGKPRAKAGKNASARAPDGCSFGNIVGAIGHPIRLQREQRPASRSGRPVTTWHRRAMAARRPRRP